MKTISLLDNYEAHGDSLEEFKEETNMLDEATEYVKVPKSMIEILSYENAIPDKNGYRVLRLNKDTVSQFEEGEKGIHFFKNYIKLSSPNGPTPELDESMQKHGFVINNTIHNSVYAVSSLACITLANKTNINPSVLDGRSNLRDAFIARQLANSGEKNLLLCIRRREGASKVFAFLSRYNPQPLSVLGDIAQDIINTDTLGQPKVQSWTCNHDICQISIEFPEAAEDFKETYGLKNVCIPGVLLQNSGIGSCSLTAYSTSRTEKAIYPVILETVRRRHTSTMGAEDIINDISDTILARLTKLPERLADLLAIPIGVNPASDSAARRNKREVLRVYKYVTRKLSIQKMIGKERYNKLIEKLELRIDPYRSYTAYDVADDFLSLPDDTLFSDFKATRRIQLQQACGRAPFVTFKQESIAEEMDSGEEDE